jgi:hypothetical protein
MTIIRADCVAKDSGGLAATCASKSGCGGNSHADSGREALEQAGVLPKKAVT